MLIFFSSAFGFFTHVGFEGIKLSRWARTQLKRPVYIKHCAFVKESTFSKVDSCVEPSSMKFSILRMCLTDGKSNQVSRGSFFILIDFPLALILISFLLIVSISLLTACFANAITFIAGFRSTPMERNPFAEAIKVVVPPPFQGSKITEE